MPPSRGLSSSLCRRAVGSASGPDVGAGATAMLAASLWGHSASRRTVLGSRNRLGARLERANRTTLRPLLASTFRQRRRRYWACAQQRSHV